MTQLSLIDAAVPDAPRCALCTRPAHWSGKHQRYERYCRSNGCQSGERLCAVCDNPFAIGAPGAGTKYCSTECKRIGYTIGWNPGGRTECAWCGARGRSTAGSVWPYVCAQCIHPIRQIVPRLRAHRVSLDRARLLLTEPNCEICGRNIVEPTRIRSNSIPRPLLVVDHDHQCCPAGKSSCGKCVRGLICAQCNSAAGMVYDDPETALALAEYLRKARTRGPRF